MRLPIVLMIAAILLNAAADFYIYRSLQRYNSRKLWRRVYLVAAAACMALLIAILCMPFRSGGEDVLRATMWMLFTFLSLFTPKVIYVIFDLSARIPMLFRKPTFRPLSWFGLFMALVAFVAMWWGALFNRFNLDVRNVEIASPEVPKGFDGFTIAQISDLHVGTFGNDTTFLCDLVGKINSLHPDLVVFTGDIVNRRTVELEPFVNVLSRISAPYGVYSILGNHDYGDYTEWPTKQAKAENMQLLKDLQRRMGWKMLNNAHDTLVAHGDTLMLIGVENIGDPPFPVYGSLAEAYPAGVSDRHAKVLLSHNPAHWDSDIQDSDSTNILLTLAGHTHAMQITMLGTSPAAWRYHHWGGLYTDKKGQNLYVNIGAGTVGFPARVGATPEITLFTLRHGNPRQR